MWLAAVVITGCWALPQQDLRTRPDPAQRTEVRVGIYLNDLILIDEPRHAFTADVAFELSWNDPRLAMEGAQMRTFDLSDVWNPDVTLLNERQAQAKLDRKVRVDSQGNVRYLQRYAGTFSAAFDLRSFPSDRQLLHFDLVFLGVTPDQIQLTIDDELNGHREALSISDWTVHSGKATVRTFQPVPGMPLPSYVYEIPIERLTGYYTWKILLPLVLIVGMAGTVFWIDPKNSGPQISVSVSSILTLIAYRFLLGNHVPKLSYLTRMDYFIMGATIMVFGALIVVVLTSSLAGRDRHDHAIRIDRWARVLYPLAMMALVFGVFLA